MAAREKLEGLRYQGQQLRAALLAFGIEMDRRRDDDRRTDRYDRRRRDERSIDRLRRRSDSFGLKKISRDTDSEAFHHLMRLQQQAIQEA